MFRKLVANLSFSPALIAEVGFYARRLKKEEATRQLALIFTALALVVQSLIFFSPPESANASSEQDMLRGGVLSHEDLIKRYRANESNIKDLLTAAGITENEVNNLQEGVVKSSDHAFIAGQLPRFGTAEGEVQFSYTNSTTGQMATAYFSPLQLLDTTTTAQQLGTTHKAWVGQSAALGWFAIMESSGNLVTKVLPQGASKATPSLKQELLALNISQGNVAASTVSAAAGDRISYTITARNEGSSHQLTPLAIALGDILEYANIIDDGGALLDKKSNTLSWPPISMPPGQVEQRTFVVQLQNPLPAIAQGASNSMSYDCILTGAYGTTSQIAVNCPPAKQIESIVSILPNIGAAGNLLFAAVIGGIVSYFYFRTRQLKEEIRLIRHNLNEGTL